MPLKTEKGFTLVEVVVALLVLAVITAAVVGIYNSGLLAIFQSGKRTEAIYEVQAKLDQAISKGIAEVAETDPPLKIHFQGLEKPIEIEGKIVTKDSDTAFGPQKRKVSASVFIPFVSDAEQ
ncbi:MAG TPA: prepilin-type N-terminal cleavage/methylation domain-containing protein [Firmicutes bacterium]|nr:prepilin-type N-terminal cleavage/methylation domain-containing protein [Bacillota bacterium]